MLLLNNPQFLLSPLLLLLLLLITTQAALIVPGSEQAENALLVERAEAASISTASDLPPVEDSRDNCLTNPLEMSLYCRGSRAIRNVIHNLSKTDKPIVLFRGLEIVPIAKDKSIDEDSVNANNIDNAERTTFLASFAEYLRTHELNVKFSDLLADESAQYMARDMERNGVGIDNIGVGTEEGRKKDKGQGLILAMALMSAKMMAVLGLGGIGALAMKALGVAMMALVMAGLVGLKSLSQHGGESSHSVSYVAASDGHHHKRRRRRSIPATIDSQVQHGIAYRGWPHVQLMSGSA